ncbi:MAG: AAA family ATPase [Bacteroidota bacterium]
MKIDHSQIKDALLSEVAKAGSARKAANLLGISDATVSKILNDKASDVSEKMWLKLANYFGLTSWRIIGTANFNTIHSVCEDAQNRHRLRCILGYSGAGKTTALKKYRMRKDVDNAFYVLCQKAMSQRELLLEIMKSMGLNQSATPYRMLQLISERLNTLESPLLMLDDAGKLNNDKLMLVQQIRDMTEHNAGIVLAGVTYMYDNIQKALRRQKMGIPELVSRIGQFQNMQEPTLPEVMQICKVNGIESEPVQRAIFHRFKEYRQIETSVLDLLHYASRKDEIITVRLAEQIWGVDY